MKRIETSLGFAAALALFAIMLLTFCDVLGRKLLGQSIAGATELTELLMLLTIFLALPLASLKGEHVAFDLLDTLLPGLARQLQHVLSHGVVLLALTGAAWLVSKRAARAMEEGDVTAQLGIALGPLHYLAAVMLLLTALAHLYLLLKPREMRAHA
ncbi:MAG: TRAP transporter small permease [Betaproteobacteria bacterium]|nr:TRAP transporter small permease [Betaproteobacteria bacterium]